MDIDRCGFFEVTSFSDDDTRRNDMYMANAIRAKAEDAFADYEEYLCSLEMSAEIKNFDEIYMQRISQLTNKTNQFNLTTRRLSYAEICTIAADDNYISLYGKLTDKYGDNGVVTVVIGKKNILSGILGHTRAAFTLDTYTHTTGDMQKRASEIVGDFLTDIFGEELRPWEESAKTARAPSG